MPRHAHNSSPTLVADIGGTSARLALASAGELVADSCRVYRRSEFPGFPDALQRFIEELGVSLQGGRACLAIASPVDRQRIAAVPDEPISFTNSPWKIVPSLLEKRFGLRQLIVVNDFEAQAYALPRLAAQQLLPLGERSRGRDPQTRWPLLVVGPGTGLGAAIWLARARRAVCTEGGQIQFAPVDETDDKLLRALRAQYRHPAVEHLLSGDGLAFMHRSLHEGEALSAAEVTAGALAGDSPRCSATLERFFAVLGSTVGDLTLATGARGGVFLAGGILPRVAELLEASDFRERFIAKGRFAEYLDAIPTWLVRAEEPGLIGAAAASEIF